MTTTNIALLGYGYWGANLARNIDNAEECRLWGIIEADDGRKRAAASKYSGAKIWANLDDALSDNALEAIVVASPAGTHAELALQCLAAGRHVLVEKPLAMSNDEAIAIEERAADNRLVAMVGHTFLYSEPVRALREYIAKGRLGDIMYLYSQRLNLGRIRSDCNALWNFGPHDISIMLYLLEERPIEVSARGFAFLQPGIEDVSFASLTFASGKAAHMHVSWLDPRKVRSMTVVGSTAMAVYDDVSVGQELTLYDSGAHPARAAEGFSSLGEHQWLTRAGDVHIPKMTMAEPLGREIQDFAYACQTGRAPVASARHGAEVVSVICAIEESVRLGGSPVGLTW